MIFLTVDLGNTRCKLRLWSTHERRAPLRIAGVDLESLAGVGAKASAWLDRNEAVEAGALCSVAPAAIESELADVLRASLGERFRARLDPGLSCACREPAEVGRDRLFAARAALARARGSAIVVDAGTALTVDAVRSDGTFLGGAIAPGPELLAQALSRGTARLPRVEPHPRAVALGLDTRAALLAGVGVGFRGAARELAERVSEEAGLAGAPVVLTGGARGFLLEPSAFPRSRVVEEEDLVHLGVLAACLESLPLGRETP